MTENEKRHEEINKKRMALQQELTDLREAKDQGKKELAEIKKTGKGDCKKLVNTIMAYDVEADAINAAPG